MFLLEEHRSYTNVYYISLTFLIIKVSIKNFNKVYISFIKFEKYL